MYLRRHFLRKGTWVGLLLLAACGDLIPVGVGRARIPDFTLHHEEIPCEIPLDLVFPGGARNLHLELALTYEVVINRNSLPVRMVLLDSLNEVVAHHELTIPLRVEGEWLGAPEDNEVDYTLTFNQAPIMELEPGRYDLHVYANDPSGKDIPGVVEIAARFYDVADLNRPPEE